MRLGGNNANMKRLSSNVRSPARSKAAVLGLLVLVPGALVVAAGGAAADNIAVADAKLPSPRFLASAAWHAGAAYVLGGYDPLVSYLDDVVRYDPFTDRTELLGVAAGDSPGAASAVDIGAGILVIGGWNGRVYLDEIRFVQPELNVSEVIGRLPVPMQGTSAVWTGAEVYIFGGATYGGSGGYSKDVLRFVPGMKVAEKVGELFNARQYTSAVWTGSKAYVFGGIEWDSDPVDFVEAWDPATHTSENVASLPAGRWSTAAAMWGGQAYVFGGTDGLRTYGDILRFDPATREVFVAGSLPASRVAASAAATPLGIAVMGGWGGGAPTPFYDDIVLYTPDVVPAQALQAGLPGGQTPAVESVSLHVPAVGVPEVCTLEPCHKDIIIAPEDPSTPVVPGVAVPLPSGLSIPRTCTVSLCTTDTTLVPGLSQPLPQSPPRTVDVPAVPLDVCAGPNDIICYSGGFPGASSGPTPGVYPAPLNTNPVVLGDLCSSPWRAVCQGPITLPGGPQQLTPPLGPMAVPLPEHTEEPLCGIAPEACVGPIHLFGPIDEATPGIPASPTPALWVLLETEGFYFPVAPNLGDSQPIQPIPIDVAGQHLVICGQTCQVLVGPEAGAHGRLTVAVGIGEQELQRVTLPVDIGA